MSATEHEALDLVRHVARRNTDGSLVLPAFVLVGDSETIFPIQDVKADPKLRADFVRKLQRDLQLLNELREEKVRLISYLQEPESKESPTSP
jgi:hypothetical protein